MKKLFLILLAILIPVFNTCRESARDMEIYLLIGQSNMAGRAEIRPEDSLTLKGVFLFKGDSLEPWVPAKNPFNIYSTIRKGAEMQKLGPGYSFGRTMHEYSAGKNIGLVVNARGGSSIREWLPGREYYNEAVSRTREAMKYGQLKGILWHQGSSDVNRIEQYPVELETLILSLRKDFNISDLAFVAGELSEDKPIRAGFNNMIDSIPSRIPFTSVVSVDGLHTFDSTHFDSPSQIILGQRFALEMLNLQKNNDK